MDEYNEFSNQNIPSSTDTLFQSVKAFLLGLALSAAVFIYVFFSLQNDSRIKQELEANGEIAIGKVVHVDCCGRERGHILKYEFSSKEDPDYIYSGQTSDETFVRSFREGTPVRVIYSSRRKNISLVEWDYEKMHRSDSLLSYTFPNAFVNLILISLFCFGILIMAITMAGFRQVVRWEKEGQMTAGKIQAAWKTTHHTKGGTVTNYHVKYEYQVMGKQYLLKQEVSDREYSLWTTGTTVKIKYLPESPIIARIID